MNKVFLILTGNFWKLCFRVSEWLHLETVSSGFLPVVYLCNWMVVTGSWMKVKWCKWWCDDGNVNGSSRCFLPLTNTNINTSAGVSFHPVLFTFRVLRQLRPSEEKLLLLCTDNMTLNSPTLNWLEPSGIWRGFSQRPMRTQTGPKPTRVFLLSVLKNSLSKAATS